jgi:hypothetical protein
MAGIFEQMGYDAMTKVASGGDGSRHYTSRMPEEEFAQGHNSRFNYMMPTQKSYQGKSDIADVVRKQADRKPAMDLYQNPVKNLAQNESIYASLLNYRFMS